MCVCVFGIHVLKIIVERWFWELNMFIGSLVELHVWLHSCLCFSLLEKLLLKASSTPSYLSSFLSFFLSQSRQLLDTWWIDWESSCPLDSFSTARSIDRASVLVSGGLFLDICLTHASVDNLYLDTYLDTWLDTSRHLHLSRFTEVL